MSLAYIYLSMALILPAMWLGVLVHESGHALCARLAGIEVTSFGTGYARPLLLLRLGRTRLFIGATRPLTGINFFFNPDLFASPSKMALALAGGFLGNGALAVFAVLMLRAHPETSWWWLPLASINGVMFITNMLPFRVSWNGAALRSDGGQILQHLRAGGPSIAAAAALQNVAPLRSLLCAIDDRSGLALRLCAAAAAAAAMRMPSEAAHWLEEAEGLGTVEHAGLKRYQLICRAIAEAAAEDVPALANTVAQLEVESSPPPAVQVYVALIKASMLQLRGELEAAGQLLQQLEVNPLVQQHRLLRLDFLSEQIHLAQAENRLAEAATLLEQASSLRQRDDQTLLFASLQTLLGSHYRRAGDLPAARPYYTAAVRDLSRMHGLLVSTELQKSLLAGWSDVVQEAEAVFEPGSAELVMLADLEKPPRPVVAQLEKRGLFYVGVATAVINALCAGHFVTKSPDLAFALLVDFEAVFLFVLGTFFLYKKNAWLRRHAASVTYYGALLPWLLSPLLR